MMPIRRRRRKELQEKTFGSDPQIVIQIPYRHRVGDVSVCK